MLRQSLHLVSRRLWPVAEQRRALSSVSDGPVAVELLDRRVLRLAGEDVVHFLQVRGKECHVQARYELPLAPSESVKRPRASLQQENVSPVT